MPPVAPPPSLKTKVRRLTTVCLALWLFVTMAPVLAAAHPGLHLWGWPLDFWLAAQGCVLAYLALVAFYAWQVNRWERQTGESAIDIPTVQDV